MKQFAVIVLSLLLLSAKGGSQTPALRQKHFNTEKGLALSGYDPVSYFEGKPQKGVPAFSYAYQDITYHFISAAHLAAFKQRPAAYEPQYGGWCAYAMGSTGEKVEVDPETFKISNGRLYVFYNKFFNNTLKSWNKDEANLRAKADENWLKYK